MFDPEATPKAPPAGATCLAFIVDEIQLFSDGSWPAAPFINRLMNKTTIWAEPKQISAPLLPPMDHYDADQSRQSEGVWPKRLEQVDGNLEALQLQCYRRYDYSCTRTNCN